jgi:hypothetical protein
MLIDKLYFAKTPEIFVMPPVIGKEKNGTKITINWGILS